jgi:hypothetical protein
LVPGAPDFHDVAEACGGGMQALAAHRPVVFATLAPVFVTLLSQAPLEGAFARVVGAGSDRLQQHQPRPVAQTAMTVLGEDLWSGCRPYSDPCVREKADMFAVPLQFIQEVMEVACIPVGEPVAVPSPMAQCTRPSACFRRRQPSTLPSKQFAMRSVIPMSCDCGRQYPCAMWFY